MAFLNYQVIRHDESFRDWVLKENKPTNLGLQKRMTPLIKPVQSLFEARRGEKAKLQKSDLAQKGQTEEKTWDSYSYRRTLTRSTHRTHSKPATR